MSTRRVSSESEIRGSRFPAEPDPSYSDWFTFEYISAHLQKLVPETVSYPLLIALADTMIIFTIAALSALMLWDTSCGYITYIEVRLPLPGERSAPGSPWPLPKKWEKSQTRLTLDPEMFYMSSNANGCDVIYEGLRRYKKMLVKDLKGTKLSALPQLEGLQVRVLDESLQTDGGMGGCAYPQHGEDESYDLEVPTKGAATLTSNTIWGALRGLETFSQLVHQDPQGHLLINSTKISDAPRYKYRGLLLDTSRHYQPIKTIKQNLDAMSYNKFNAFHWHIIDDQSFPFESKIFPNLTQLGAYSPRHIYTQDNIRDIIQYARYRGIRVIPEFDTPGHTQAFGRAFPWLLTPCYGQGPEHPYTPNHPEHAAAEMLNPMLNDTYTVFKTLVEEVKTVFYDEYIHLGMDEVYYACWKSSPEIKEFMRKNNYTQYNQVEQHYVKKTLKNVKDTGYKYMIWQDPIDNDVEAEPDTLVGVWKDNSLDTRMDKWENYIKPIAKKGYQIILSACWYLNYISYGMDWKKYYECDPRNFDGTEAEKDLVVGGEVCMWGEYVDGTNLIARLWPRASAVAERLWSPAELTNDTDSASFRLDEHRCRMVRRGIPAQPILNGFCGDYEWDMDDTQSV
ncbi:beta-hexosaminidase subunit beta [Caerostris extrusa]|uniref:Beta-hexosaminidase n=1 Tax=Caerostris extrusa TaxID=172846 RepID=A0AAV4XZQ5_CAEEX|nr:beta-hexosaminidase subunit beta [Caerostris extrusa]